MPHTLRRLRRVAAVSDFRPAQAAASVTAPWDPRPEIRGDGDRRRTEEKGGKMRQQKHRSFRAFRRQERSERRRNTSVRSVRLLRENLYSATIVNGD